MNQDLLLNIMKANSFIPPSMPLPVPLIVVFRNTGFYSEGNPMYVSDNGSNCCDIVFLVDEKVVIPLSGRSYPHEKYQRRMVDGTGKANYIATGYYPGAWRKGFHLGKYRALVQYRKFMVWRSSDMELKDDDDYSEFDIVCDNFHGWAPKSKGCVTVTGNMGIPSEDWKRADEWIYSKPDTFFHAMILDYEDLNAEERLRIGSTGTRVAELQEELAKYYDIKIDGDFGPYTHVIIRQFQREHGIADDGICGPDTMLKFES